MDFLIILVLSILFQLIAAILAWRLVWVARIKPAWALIAVAISLIAVHHSLTFYQWLVHASPFDRTAELLSLSISVLMMTGVIRIGPFFISAKNSSEALLEKEERFQAVVATATDAIIEADAAGNIISWNKAAQSIFGYERQEILGKSVNFLIPAGHREAHAAAMTRLLTSGEAGSSGELMELTGLKKDGGEFPLELSLCTWETAKGKFFSAVIRDITLRKFAEEILRKQHAFEQFLIDTIPFPVFYKDAKGLYIGCNQAFEDFFGWTKEFIIGKSVHDLAPQEIADTYFEKDQELIEHPGTQVYEFIAKDKAGIPHDVIFHKASFPADDGSVGGLIGAFLDISERKRAEDTLKQNKMRLEALQKLNQMAEAPLGEITAFALEEATRLTGSTIGYIAFLNEAESVLTLHTWSKNALQECNPCDKPLVDPLETSGLWGEAVRQRRTVIANSYAGPNPWEQSGPEERVPLTRHLNAPIFDGPNIVIVAGVCNKQSDYDESDVRQLTLLMEGMWLILQRNKVKEALLKSEQKYRFLVNNIPAVVFRGYADWAIEFFDDKITKLTGYSKENFNLKKMKWADIILEEDLNGATEAFIQAVENKKAYIKEYRIKHKDGEIRWIQARGQIICAENGNVEFVSGVFFDVTERKRFEEDRLTFSKIESLGLLAGGIAHDFNNILTAILGNVSLAMLELPKEGRTRERLERSEKACFQAQVLAQQLLTFAKGGAPVKKLLQLGDLIKESAGFVCRGSQTRCDYHLHENLWAIVADPGQIRQVFQNLLINAIQAMPAGGTIKINAINSHLDAMNDLSLQAGNYVKIAIQDQGIGIPPEYLPKIFDPYFTTKQAGSGLGLATTYSIIKGHEGHISAQSKLGKGTTFQIYLPASAQPASVPSADDHQITTGKGRILVMDDEEMVRDVIGLMLDNLGYEANLARDGQEAVKKFSEAQGNAHRIDLVILDLTVPGGMGGKECLRQLRLLDPNIKAIVSSGYSDDPVMADFSKYGFNGVIAKPYKVSDISHLLHELLN